MAGHNEWSKVKRRNGALDLACDRQSCEFAATAARRAVAGWNSRIFPAAAVGTFKRSERNDVLGNAALPVVERAERARDFAAGELPASKPDRLRSSSRGQANAASDSLQGEVLGPGWTELTRQPDVTVSRKAKSVALQFFTRSRPFEDHDHDQCADARADFPNHRLVKASR